MERKLHLLLVTVALLIGIIVALLAGILAKVGGRSLPDTILYSGGVFVGAVSFVLLILGALGVVGFSKADQG